MLGLKTAKPMPTDIKRILCDQHRVLSTADHVAQRLPNYLRQLSSSSGHDSASLTNAVRVTNLVAYHVARSDPREASKLLSAGLYLVRKQTGRSGFPPTDVAIDLLINRIRLLAVTGSVGLAIGLCSALLEPRETIEPIYLAHTDGLDLVPTNSRPTFLRIVRIERAVLRWRGGYPHTPDSKLADTALWRELDWRNTCRINQSHLSAVRKGDTLKRALHRGIVTADEGVEPTDPASVEVLRQGLEQLEIMHFICPSTPLLWVQRIQSALSDQDELPKGTETSYDRLSDRAAIATIRNLNRLLGLPSKTEPKLSLSSASKQLTERWCSDDGQNTRGG